MSSLGRRGFLQLVGLGATGSLLSVPLFGSTEAIAAPPSLLAGHLVISSGFVEGRARAVMSDGTPDDFTLRSSNRGEPPPPHLFSMEARRASPLKTHVEDAHVVVKSDFGSGLIRLKQHECPHHRLRRSIALLPGESLEIIAYAQAKAWRQEIRDAAIRTLANARGPVGQTLVTVVHDPIWWNVSSHDGPKVYFAASYDQWIVDGIVHSTEILSESGEYPLAENMAIDLDHLMWIDRKMLLGETPDALREPSLLDRVRL
jgi:hypothetical protein